MNEEIKASLQVIWETLNGALHDIREGNKLDAEGAVEECIFMLEARLGIHAQEE